MFDIEFIKKEILILIASMMPISEVRGAIPLGATLGVSPERSIILGILGNMFIVPILLIILKAAMLTSISINNCIYKERYYFFYFFYSIVNFR